MYIFYVPIRSNKNEEDEEESTSHGSGHGVRKIKITAIQQVRICRISKKLVGVL